MKTLKQSLFMVACLGGVAWGNAFNINEHDARVTGRGGASAASNTAPSSIIFNPGGIPIAEGTNVSIGSSLYLASGSYQAEGQDKYETDQSPAIVPNFYITSRLTDVVAIGVGFHLPFGLAVSWPDPHPQGDVIQDQSLRTYYITPSVGLNLRKSVPGLSIGGGLDIVPATVQLENRLYFGDPNTGGVEGTAVLGGDALGFGFRAGAMYHPPSVKGLKLGVMYRSQVTLDFEGTGDFDIDDPYRAGLPPDGPISTSVKMPMSLWSGIAYSPTPKLEVEANAVWIDWSAFNELRINLPGVDSSGQPNVTVSPQNYEDRVTWRLGAEYDLSDVAAVRAGFIYDPTPIPTTTLTARLPDINRVNFTVGGSYKFGSYGAHLGFLLVTPGERDTSAEPYMPTFKGTYGVTAFVTSLMFSGTFGGKPAAAPPPATDATVTRR